MKNYQYTLNYIDLGFDETLNLNPLGWNDLGLTFERNEFYNSVLRSFTLTLKFPKKPGGGGENIRESYLTKGISAKVEITISELNPNTYEYDNFYEGILDFNRYKDERDFTEIGVIDAGKLQRFISRDEIDYNLYSLVSTDDVVITDFSNSPKDIILKPIDIYLTVEQEVLMTNLPDSDKWSNDPNQGDLEDKQDFFNDPTIDINEIGDRLKTESDSITIYTNDTDGDVLINFQDTSTIEDNSIILYATTTPQSIVEMQIYIEILVRKGEDTLTSYFLFNETFNYFNISSSNDPINYDISVLADVYGTFTVPPEYSLELYCGMTAVEFTPQVPGISVMVVEIRNDFRCNLDFIEQSLSIDQTPCESFFPYEAFTRLIQLMTSETDTDKLLYSEFFGRVDSEFQTYGSNGDGSLDGIGSAWNIRQFPDKAFNVNMRDLFGTFGKSIYALGLGFDRTNDRFYIEPIENFYDSSYLMFDLGEVFELVISPYQDAFFSKINSGYEEKGEYEDFQGVNEYNLSSEHSAPLPVKQTEIIKGVLNTDSIGIETTRRYQYSDNASKDTKNDDKIYIYRTDGSTVIRATGASGFLGIEQYYNLAFTPRENIIRHAGLYKSSLWLHDLLIKFVKAQKDANITYENQNGNTVNEHDDIDGTDLLKTQLFQPEIYEFESKIYPYMVEVLNDNPHGYIRFTFDGNTYEGFLLSVESGEYYQRKANYRLIAKELTVGNNFVYENDYNFTLESSNNFVLEN